MSIFHYLLGFAVLGSFSMAAVVADEHGGVHIRIPSCEDANEEPCQSLPPVCMELKPWYHHQHYDQYEDIEQESYELQDDTAWPGQREDYSDYLMRSMGT